MFSRLVIGPFLFPWNVKWLIFSSWIVISIVAVKHDFAKLFSVKREINVIFLMSLFFVNCERTVLFSVKRDLDPPLYHPLPRSEEGQCDIDCNSQMYCYDLKMYTCCTHCAGNCCTHLTYGFKRPRPKNSSKNKRRCQRTD